MMQTKDLRTTMSGKIIQLDYDFITSLDGCCSYCLTDAQVQMILGVLDYFGWSTRWYSESGLIDQSVILKLQADLGEALMCGCCDENGQLKRLTPDGHWQISNDDGVTWIDYPPGDPRQPVPRRPTYPVPVEGEEIPKCQWADSIVQMVKTQFVAELSLEATIRDIIAALGALLTLVLSLAGVVSVLIGLASLPAIIFAFGVLAMQEAFTEEVWDRFRCNLYDNMGASGINSQEQVDAIYARIATDETGIVVIVLQQIVALFGVNGMINAANAGFGSPDATCDCEDCSCDLSIWSRIDDRMNLPVIDGCTITQEAALIAGNYYIGIMTDYPDCCVMQYNVTSGSVSGAHLLAPCDYTGSLSLDEATGWVNAGLTINAPVRGWLLRSSAPFSAFFSVL